MVARSAGWVAVVAGDPQRWPYAASGDESEAAAKVGRKGGRRVVRSDSACCRRTQLARRHQKECQEGQQRRRDHGDGLRRRQAVTVRGWREGSGGAGAKGERAVGGLPLRGGDRANHRWRGGGGPNGERGGSGGGRSAFSCDGRRGRQWTSGGTNGAPVVVQREKGGAVDGWPPRRSGDRGHLARRRSTEWEEGWQGWRRRARRGSLRRWQTAGGRVKRQLKRSGRSVEGGSARGGTARRRRTQMMRLQRLRREEEAAGSSSAALCSVGIIAAMVGEQRARQAVAREQW